MNIRSATAILMISATAALAHSGVKDAQVLKRMDSMKSAGTAMQVLGDMAKGKTPFDAASARAAAADVADQAALTVALFTPQANDPKSEARPDIWLNFSDFSDRADVMETVAREASMSLTSAADLPQVLARMGATCKSCHSLYRD